jgi:hypothetical protein
VEPSRKAIEPVAVEGDTVAVIATVWPNVVGLADDIRLVVVEALLTVWLRAVDVLPASFVSPL